MNMNNAWWGWNIACKNGVPRGKELSLPLVAGNFFLGQFGDADLWLSTGCGNLGGGTLIAEYLDERLDVDDYAILIMGQVVHAGKFDQNNPLHVALQRALKANLLTIALSVNPKTLMLAK